MTALPDALAVKVSKIIGQFGSDNPNVVTTAAAMLQRTLSSNGCDLNDLAEHITKPPETRVIYRDRPVSVRPGPRDYGDWRPTWQGVDPRRRHKAQVARVRAAPPGFLSAWEAEFCGSLARQLEGTRNLSPRQTTILADIFTRFEERYG